MFSIFKKNKKNIKTDEIKNFNDIIKVIEDFIYFEEFEKATKAINEVIQKENESFKYYIEKVSENNKKNELNKLKNKLKILQELKQKNDEKKKKYQENLNKKRKKEELKFIEKKINEYISNGIFDEAINLLDNFLKENLNDLKIINFVNKQKKYISKRLEKYKKKKEKEIRDDTYMQAKELIGEIKNNNIKSQDNSKDTFFIKLKNKFNFYYNFKKKLKDKRLLDEINILIQTQNEKNDLIIKTKLAKIHSGISKEISGEKINGYDLYGKILGADKISGDCLGFYKTKNNNKFFIADATGHGIKAGLIISQMTKKFYELKNKNKTLEEIVMEINNSLKQELKSGNFITSIFFNIDSNSKKLEFIGMGHEPMFIFRKNTLKVEKVITGGLAAGIRIIKDIGSIKKKNIVLDDGDIILCYTDGIVETRNSDGEMYSIERVGKKFEEFSKNSKGSLKDIYKSFIEDLKKFNGGSSNYSDDVTLLLIKRDKNKEILSDDKQIQEIIKKEGLELKNKKKFLFKTPEEIKNEILKMQKENHIKNILKSLDILYKTGEFSKLKQDCIRYIKDGIIHKKINFYLKKVYDNENLLKIKQKEKKIQDKYNVLKELYKKGDYETVINECLNIINKDGNI